jgi:hypothetical protein
MRIRWVLAIILVLVTLISSSCAAGNVNTSSSYNSKLGQIVQPYSFSLSGWELKAFFGDIRQKIVDPQSESVLTSQAVMNYFSYVIQLNTLKSDLQMAQAKAPAGNVNQYEAKTSEVNQKIATLKPVVEQTIARQINQVLADQGISNPFGNNWFKMIFPPVNFNLEKPLYELIISPRDKIQRVQSITIKPEINSAQIEEVENSVGQLNMSALVVQIGGLGATYPTFVANNADLRWTIDTAVHEWLHQYLAFKPLGFHYVLDLLGLSHDYEIDTLNETVASMIGQELGSKVYDQYYSQYQTSPQERAPVGSGFDYNAAMREIRKTVDSYLEQGQVQAAEKYMQEQQQYLASKGHYIRKLNQAYFAFYGTYANGPTSIDPIGVNLRLLRKQSPSVKGFLDSVAGITSSQQLKALIGKGDPGLPASSKVPIIKAEVN